MRSPPNLILIYCIIMTACTSLVQEVYGQEREQATLVGRWFDESIVGSDNHNNAYNEVWGLAVNGHEYGVIGSTSGTHFIDITDESKIHEAHFVAGGAMGGIIIHRDYHDHNGYLYAVSDQGDASTLQIIDVKNLPESIDVVYDSGEYSTNTHNIFIDTTTHRLYLCKTRGKDLQRVPMRILDISDPIEPQLIYTLEELEGFGQVGIIHDAYIDKNIAYLNVGHQGFAIVDFTDINAPITKATLFPQDYAQSGYNHSGYVTEDHRYYYMADENHGLDIKVVDIQNIPDIFVTEYIDALSDSEYSIPHNMIVHNGYLYASYYYDGLQIFDLDDPANPINVGYFPTSHLPHKDRFEGAWGVYPLLPSGRILVSDMQEGLFVLQIPSATSIEEEIPTHVFQILPNPSNGYITIKTNTNNSTTPIRLYVYTIDGHQVLNQILTDDVTHLSLHSGFYIATLKSGNICSTQRLIVR